MTAPIYWEVLQALLLPSSCPRPVLTLCGARVLSLLVERKGKPAISAPGFDTSALRSAVSGALSGKTYAKETWSAFDTCTATTLPGGGWSEPKQAIQAAFTLARAGKAPVLDVERCIEIIPPTKFLQLLWSELIGAATMGEMENCRRIATFVMTMPRTLTSAPLLPIFLHIVTPWLMATLEHQPSAEHAMNVELLVTVISSVLTFALHLELAMHSVTRERRSVLGESSSGMARKFAATLRGSKTSRTSQAIIQSLAGSPSFVANFPMFMNELSTV